MEVAGKWSVNLSCNESIFSIYHEYCKLCNSQFVNPHVLSCLHIFCEQCVISLLCKGNTYLQNNDYQLKCPDCNKMVTVELSGFRSLLMPTATTLVDKVDICSFDCSSCGIGTSSLFRCQYCSKFLCHSCLSSHNYFDCTSDYQGKNKTKLHFCYQHNKCMKYYCFTCETAACIFCLVKSHQGGGHIYDLIKNAKKNVRSDIQSLLRNAEDNLNNCNSNVAGLLDLLTKLQCQHDNAKSQVESNYESCRKFAEKYRSDALKELDDLYLEREIDVRNLLNKVEEFIENVGESFRITKKLLMEGNSVELLNLRKFIPVQFTDLNYIANICESSIESINNEMDGMVQDVLTQFYENLATEQQKVFFNNEPGSSSSTQIEPEENIICSEPITESTSELLMPITIECKVASMGVLNGQFNCPQGFCLGVNDEILVADTNNHRIQVFRANGSFKFQFGNPGREDECLWFPRKVAVMKKSNRRIVVNDRGVERTRFQIFSEYGAFLKKIPFFDVGLVASLAITHEGYIVICDSAVPSISIINELGELIRRFNCSSHVTEPSDMTINGNEFFICDYKAHRVAVFHETGIFQRYIGDKDLLSYPNGIDISSAGDIFVSDSDNNEFHLAQFNRDGTFVKAYVCERLKTSRCCGLKLSVYEQLITILRNNNTILIVDKKIMQQMPPPPANQK